MMKTKNNIRKDRKRKSRMIKGITKFWYGVMNSFQLKILEACAFLQNSLIVVAVEIESEVMKL